ncbi:hypothetical protein DFJ73DRAFT_12216 [Zopfochytrium polystomum]|nr:hypothetical protein DFJ73DRAFT_12216 [Zopfochytrium polystomum]
MDSRPAKAHRARQAGPKAAKKSQKQSTSAAASGNAVGSGAAQAVKKNDNSAAARRNNPKAFAPNSGRRADKTIRRNMDKSQTRLHVPMVDRTPDVPAPFVVAVVGPPQSGKTTLIRSLVKRYTRHNLNEVCGPITVVSGKKQRLTFLECNNDLNSMIDTAKVADLVLLLIDGSFGFEMETFEFLNILQTHGFPRVMGVLTHLDRFKDNKRLRKTKKRLKQRFWTEIYQGAKLFYLSGVINGRYPKQEVLNLSRFISVMKFRPLIWRNTHPYMLADRVEDLTDPELVQADPKCDRTVSLYGYLRGSNLKLSTKIHVPGVGDQSIHHLSALPDPCPLPDKVRKLLNEKHKLIYAPMSDVGGILHDKDAIYINVPGLLSKGDGVRPEDTTEGERLVMDLQESQNTIADKIRASELRLFSGSQPLKAADVAMNAGGETQDDAKDDYDDDDSGDERGYGLSQTEEENDDDEEDDDDGEDSSDDDGEGLDDEAEERPGRRRATAAAIARLEGRNGLPEGEEPALADSDSEMGFDDDEGDDDNDEEDEEGDVLNVGDDEDEQEEDEADGRLRWKENLAGKAEELYFTRAENLMKKVYGGDSISASSSAKTSEPSEEDDDVLFEIPKAPKRAPPSLSALDTCRTDVSLKSLFQWEDESVLESLRYRFVTSITGANDDAEVHGDFEDLETGLVGTADDGNSGEKQGAEPSVEDLDKKREQLKRKFDALYDGEADEDAGTSNIYDNAKEEMAQQKVLNDAEFEGMDDESRAAVEGRRAGTYVRIVLKNIPHEFITYLDPFFPIILGGLTTAEETVGFSQARIKKHRWHQKILKTNDPLILSVGWRRFQTIPLYSLNDGARNKMLKYTPEHMHCLATFYGPVVSPNTGFCAFRSLADGTTAFRISATGVILDVNQSSEVVKKLKLTGVPFKIFKNTAYIKNMFTSALEVAKFEGVRLRTVSGIRGQIKKPDPKHDGTFRATFEDKILMSDIVFLRAWYPVKPKKFYNPVCTLLLQDKKSWKGMRLLGQLRVDEGLKIPNKSDSRYKPIVRKRRVFNKLNIPRKLLAELPFATKPKIAQKQGKAPLEQRRAVVLEPHERKVQRLLTEINTIKREKDKKRKEKDAISRAKAAKERAKREEKMLERRKESSKKHFAYVDKLKSKAGKQ